jgi:hypothetical protein
MTETDHRIVTELGRSVQRFAGENVRKVVMEGSESLDSSSESQEFAEWVKGAMERLDNLVDETTRYQIMHNCGQNCFQEYQEVIQFAKDRFQHSKSLDDFLENEPQKHFPGTRLRREGNVLYQVYDPTLFVKALRCYCYLLRDLPSNKTVSLTYCHCSEGFIKSYWEAVLGKPVKVEILESAISGGKECRFAIYIPEEVEKAPEDHI